MTVGYSSVVVWRREQHFSVSVLWSEICSSIYICVCVMICVNATYEVLCVCWILYTLNTNVKRSSGHFNPIKHKGIKVFKSFGHFNFRVLSD